MSSQQQYEQSWGEWFSSFVWTDLRGPATLAPKVSFDSLKNKIDSQAYIRDINQQIISTQLQNLKHIEVPERKVTFTPETGVLGEMFDVFSGNDSDPFAILKAIKQKKTSTNEVSDL